jgi:hypothetical protein
MTKAPASARRRADEVERLRLAAAEIAQELRQVSERLQDLTAAVEAMVPESDRPDEVQVAPTAAKPTSTRGGYEEFRVTVRPLPELAMAAVAETSLRGLPGVRKVLSVERVDDWATFVLEVSGDVDLVSEMRTAMPVGFRVAESRPNDLSLELKWLWGTDSA